MINETTYLQVVGETKADITEFIDLALTSEEFREMVVKHLINNEAINVYYHSYQILSKATQTEPALFYPYWEAFSSLLLHGNSYHRNYGMELIANLMVVDTEKHFDLHIEDYYKQLCDEKISTIKHCISYSSKILIARPDLTPGILQKIIEALRVNDHSERHQNFLLSSFVTLLNQVDNTSYDSTIPQSFLKEVLNTTKSKKLIKEVKKYLFEQQTV